MGRNGKNFICNLNLSNDNMNKPSTFENIYEAMSIDGFSFIL